MGYGSALGYMIDQYDANERKRLEEQERYLKGSIYQGRPNEYDTLPSAPKSTKEYEGFRSTLYYDTEGNPTIGYGHKVTPEEMQKFSGTAITEEEASRLYEIDMQRERDKFYSINPWAGELPNHVKEAIDDMSFNMGGAWLNDWPNTKSALMHGNYERAGDEIMNSKYRYQVGQRALDNVYRIKGL